MLFALSTHATSVRPGLDTIVSSKEEDALAAAVKNIAAAHFIIVLAVTGKHKQFKVYTAEFWSSWLLGIIGLQIAHYFVIRKSSSERVAVNANKKKQ